MRIEVRESIMEDIAWILDLKRHPSVLEEQYAPAGLLSEDAYHRLVSMDPPWHQTYFRSWTILADSERAGEFSLAYTRYSFSRRRRCTFGWNLHPNFWGRGVMVLALSDMIRSVRTSAPGIDIDAACFSSNQRCIRVMEKSGFTPARLSFLDWFSHSIYHSSTRTVLGFRFMN